VVVNSIEQDHVMLLGLDSIWRHIVNFKNLGMFPFFLKELQSKSKQGGAILSTNDREVRS
jgi:hypothetical protein